MLKMDGYTFVKQLQREEGGKGIPVIILTAKGDKMKDLFAMEGCRDYLLKPYQAEKLLEKIKALI